MILYRVLLQVHMRIGDLRYTQSTCRDTFKCTWRSLETLGDDPDDALSGLRLWPEVVVHSDKLFAPVRKQLVTVNYDLRPEAETTKSIVGIIPQRLQRTPVICCT